MLRSFSFVRLPLALALLLAGGLAVPVAAVELAPTLAGYLPDGVAHDPAVPTPASVLGFEVGYRHARHDQIVAYMEAVAAASDRAVLEIQGRTHEDRPQPLLIVTSPANHARLDEILAARGALFDPERTLSRQEVAELPAVVLLGYSIHGNEASGANAALLLAYHLAAAQDGEVPAWLDELVVLIDPSLNPDGIGRFAQWVNMHRGATVVADRANREHNEVWPAGRTNHYWFDLNRDWLLLQHPESRNRIATFHRFLPDLLGDYHEMGSESTYFFQPGIPSRTNPLIPVGNIRLTQRLARFHADALDAAGRSYYTEESFDDFYPGKGSTYPDLNGAVGVLFEQASARGHAMMTGNGLLTFPFAVENQFLTSLSMLRGATALKDDLLTYRQEFFASGLEEAREDAIAGYAVAFDGDPFLGDPARRHHFLEILLAHRIRVYRATGEPFPAGSALGGERREGAVDQTLIVPLAQPQARLVRALFERRTEFADSTFYDISTWTLPLAFGARSRELASLDGLLGEEIATTSLPAGSVATMGSGRGSATGAATEAAPAAYLIPWGSYYAPRALHRLLAAGFRARVATAPFSAVTADGSGTSRQRTYERGTVVVPVGVLPQGLDEGRHEKITALLAEAARLDGVAVHSVASGLTASGPDLGSPSLDPLELPRPLLVVGDGISSYEVGELWHLLDRRFGVAVSLVDREILPRIELGDYTHIVMVQGDYGPLSEEATVEKLRGWVRRGGTLIATKSATGWVDSVLFDTVVENAELELPELELAEAAASDPERLIYSQYDRDRAAQLLSGAILAMQLDPTHPLAYGLGAERPLPVFRNSTRVLAPSGNPYENVGRYLERPLLSGYASDEKVALLAGSVAVRARREGRGAVIQLADNPSFRGFWYGTDRLFLNALYFGPTIKRTMPPRSW